MTEPGRSTGHRAWSVGAVRSAAVTWGSTQAEHWRPRVDRARARLDSLARRFPRSNQAILFAMATETFDACLILAAQALITALPMLVALAAFAPHGVHNTILESAKQVLGAQGAAAGQVQSVLDSTGPSRQAIGVVGLLFALGSATTLTRRLQRIFERQWNQRPGTMASSAGRWVLWLLVWAVVLATQGPLHRGHGVMAVLGWAASALLAVLLWWWTPHLLLLGRIGWRRLLPTALLIGGGSTAVNGLSRLVMPTAFDRSVHEYGPLGAVLTFMSWMVVLTGVVVMGAGLGRIIDGEGIDSTTS